MARPAGSSPTRDGGSTSSIAPGTASAWTATRRPTSWRATTCRSCPAWPSRSSRATNWPAAAAPASKTSSSAPTTASERSTTVPVSSSNSPAEDGAVAPAMDVDRALLAALARDGRASYTDLAEKVGLSVSAVHQRVRRLEQRGLITGYRATLDAKALGLPLTAFVSITPIDVAQPDDAPARLAHLSAIEECHSVAGVESYILKVRVPSPDLLETLLQEIRAAANVTTRTTVVLSTFYEDRPPL